MDRALSLFSCNSSPYPLLLQTHNHSPFKAFNFGTYCCSGRSIQIRSAKTKRKLRPSFLDQINDKWSQKVPSKREKFPWEEQKQQQQEQEQEEEEEEEEEEKEEIEAWESSGEAEIDASASSSDDPVSFTLPNHLITAPWMHGTSPERTHFNYDSKDWKNDNGFDHSEEDAVCYVSDKAESLKKEVYFNEELVEEDNVSHVVDNTERLVKEVNYNVKFNEESFERGAVSVELRRDEEIARAKDANDAVSLNKKLLRGNGEYGNVEVSHDDNRSSIELPWEKERGGEDLRMRKSNTELAERMLPEHELKRLRNVALRMFERIKVGAAGITQDLVNAIHSKWRLDEVVKLKFEEPLSCNMKRTHEILEVSICALLNLKSLNGNLYLLFKATSMTLMQSDFGVLLALD